MFGVKSIIGSEQAPVYLQDFGSRLIGKCWYVGPTEEEEGDAGNDDSRLLPGFLIRFPVSCSSSLLDQAMLHNITVQALAIYSLLFPQLSESSDQIWLSFLS